MLRIRPRLTIKVLMALPLIAAVPLGVWTEYQYEVQHRQCDSMMTVVDMMGRIADHDERERVDCLSKVGREPYDPKSRNDRLRENHGQLTAVIQGEFKSWADEACYYARSRDGGREGAKQLDDHLKGCRKRRFLAFLFSKP